MRRRRNKAPPPEPTSQNTAIYASHDKPQRSREEKKERHAFTALLYVYREYNSGRQKKKTDVNMDRAPERKKKAKDNWEKGHNGTALTLANSTSSVLFFFLPASRRLHRVRERESTTAEKYDEKRKTVEQAGKSVAAAPHHAHHDTCTHTHTLTPTHLPCRGCVHNTPLTGEDQLAQ
jgi:hypothetical protein